MNKFPSCYEELTQEYLLSKYSYDPETGIVTRKSLTNTRHVGWIDGEPPDGGYIRLRINSKCYYIHRIIWLMQTGKHVPDGMEVDHENRNRIDNKWKNLRLTNRNQNMWNYSRPKTNTSGVKGVNFDKRIGKYRARIKVFSKRIQLGVFNTIEEAADAYEQASIKYHGDFRNYE